MISVELFHLIWQSLPWPLSSLQTYSLYNSPIKPQILTTERFRSKPFTKQALDDKKCTVDGKLPKFSRSGIPSIRARIRNYPRQSSLYVDLKWECTLIKAWRKKYCICIELDVHSSRLIKTLTRQRAFCLNQACCKVSRWRNNWCFIPNHQCQNDRFATAKTSLPNHPQIVYYQQEADCRCKTCISGSAGGRLGRSEIGSRISQISFEKARNWKMKKEAHPHPPPKTNEQTNKQIGKSSISLH